MSLWTQNEAQKLKQSLLVHTYYIISSGLSLSLFSAFYSNHNCKIELVNTKQCLHNYAHTNIQMHHKISFMKMLLNVPKLGLDPHSKNPNPSNTFFCDGSFAITPTLFGQIFVILGKRDNQILCFHCVLGNLCI